MLSRTDVEGSFVFGKSHKRNSKGSVAGVDRQELQSTMLLLYPIDPKVFIIETGK